MEGKQEIQRKAEKSLEGGTGIPQCRKVWLTSSLTCKNHSLKEFPRTDSAWMLPRHQGNKQLSLALATSFVSWHPCHLSILQIFGSISEVNYSFSLCICAFLHAQLSLQYLLWTPTPRKPLTQFWGDHRRFLMCQSQLCLPPLCSSVLFLTSKPSLQYFIMDLTNTNTRSLESTVQKNKLRQFTLK